MCLKSWGTIIEDIIVKETSKSKELEVEEANFIYNNTG
jgi:hypothetical protein